MTRSDPFELERFVIAQDSGDTFSRALDELGRGRKTSHWIWFVFPQIAGLGESAMSQRFAISSLDEAKGFLEHLVLGPRLARCVDLVTHASNRTAEQIFGPIDAIKLRSSMTLFLHAAPDASPFRGVLDEFFAGLPDPATEDFLAAK